MEFVWGIVHKRAKEEPGWASCCITEKQPTCALGGFHFEEAEGGDRL